MAVKKIGAVTEKKTNNLEGQAVKDLNFKVSKSFHREYKLAAMDEEIQMKEIMMLTFRWYQSAPAAFHTFVEEYKSEKD